MAAVTVCSNFGARCFHFSPSLCYEVIGPDAVIWAFWMLSFKPAFSLSSFTLIKRFFSSSLLSAIRLVSSAIWGYWNSSWQSWFMLVIHQVKAFCMMYSAYKLNKQGDNIQLWYTLFQILNQFVVPCLFLTIASWPAYRFLRRQERWSGIPVSFRIFHSLLWST